MHGSRPKEKRNRASNVFSTGSYSRPGQARAFAPRDNTDLFCQIPMCPRHCYFPEKFLLSSINVTLPASVQRFRFKQSNTSFECTTGLDGSVHSLVFLLDFYTLSFSTFLQSNKREKHFNPLNCDV